jgi:hypothetical protein
MSKKSTTAKRVIVRQIGGDDGYQYCVLVDGRMKWSGMTRGESALARGE